MNPGTRLRYTLATVACARRSEANFPLNYLAMVTHARGYSPSNAVAYDPDLIDLVAGMRELTAADGAAIALERSESGILCVARAGALVPELGASLPDNRGLSGACVTTGEVQMLQDCETDQRFEAEAARQHGIRSALIVPVNAANRHRGALMVYSTQPNHFGETAMVVLENLAELWSST